MERAEGTLVIRPLVSERRTPRKPSPGNPNLVVGDPDELVHFDWSKHWKPQALFEIGRPRETGRREVSAEGGELQLLAAELAEALVAELQRERMSPPSTKGPQP